MTVSLHMPDALGISIEAVVSEGRRRQEREYLLLTGQLLSQKEPSAS